jgi:hypothetical protein
VYIRRFVCFLEDFGEPRSVISGEEYATRLVISILWLRLKSVVGPEYAPPNTGPNITRKRVNCGLHQSGTSVPGRNVARPENCTGFKDPGVIEDEGSIQH